MKEFLSTWLNVRTVMDFTALALFQFWAFHISKIDNASDARGWLLLVFGSYLIGRQEQWVQCQKKAL